jgi:glycerophosphoryl diester phosphodiesterase
MANAGVYLGHMEDQLGGTSNSGAVTHATGAKAYAESFGFEADNSPIQSLDGSNQTIVEAARDAGKVTALVQSGAIFEPGTAAFVAKTKEIVNPDGSRIVPRAQAAEIAKQVIESGVNFIFGGGELNLLPVGTNGFHATATQLDALSLSSTVRPSTNLIDLATSLGYTIVYTKEQLDNLLLQPQLPTKVLGVFAPIHTFNDRSEEQLAAAGLPHYSATAPTISEMLAASQKLTEAHPNFSNGSITIVEEEGTDNFGNNNNAAGTLEALRRADAAIGVALAFTERHPNTLVITAADSDAGGLQVRDPLSGSNVGNINNNPINGSSERNVPLDGISGVSSAPFRSAPDADGDQFNLGIAWAGLPDFSGSIVSKAHGLNADKLPSTLDNTKIYELMYETLFNVELAPRQPDLIAKAPAATQHTGNVIFIHPDGTTPSTFMALRNIDKGPHGRLNWDRMPEAGIYLGHMENQLTGTSNAGAVTHATGIKTFNESFGLNEDNSPIISASGNSGVTILDEAIAAGKATALVQSGHIGEPGTAAYAAKTTNRDGNSLRAREKTAEIAEQVIRSGTQVILAGGEVYLLPKGTLGFHVNEAIDSEYSDPADRPSTNLVELAKSLGYTVAYTKSQMDEAVASANATTKILGLFAADHTFDARREEALGLNTTAPLPLYKESAPTVAEMLNAALAIVSKDPDGFFVVVEEEGTDNFANINNAAGTIEATRRADAAIGVAMNFVDTKDPNTLVITAADSDAGGMQVFQFAPYTRPSGNFDASNPDLANEQPQVPFINVNRTTSNNSRVFLDGPEGSTAVDGQPWTPFHSVDSLDGAMGNFGIAWAGTPDFPGSIVSKAYGMNADQLPSTLDNTEIYNLMYKTLFGVAPKVLAERGDTQVGTTGNDTSLEGALTITGFDGKINTVFTGAGNDEVDVALVNGFENRIFAGTGVDTIYAGSRDVITGGSGDDWLSAEAGDGNRLSGGLGNDTFILGSSANRALGGSGDDKFYVLGGAGTNHLNGGAGADQFWLISEIGDRPSAKQFVMDFTVGEDMVGLQGMDFSSLSFSQVGGDTLLKVAGVEVGHFTNLSATSLNSQANFAGLS